jgi:two-component system phosphate regulon sensor histidine kinase PhoR
MPAVWRRFVLGLLAFLAAGLLIGWFYGRPETGLLVAALAALAWQVWQLLRFEKALRTYKFKKLRYGEGIWSQMSSRISYLRQRSKRHKRRYHRVLKAIRKSANALPDGGIVLNDNFEIVLCNSAAERLAGFRPRQDRGHRVDNILRAPLFSKYLQSKSFADAVEIQSPVREGDWLSCRIVPFGPDQRLLLIQDVTEHRRLSTMRREFVANASHELRSPLTVISGYLDTLVADSDVPSDWQKPLRQMQSQASRMNHIVVELLELSRLESAGAAPADEIVDVPGLLVAARKSVAGKAGIPEIKVDAQSNAQLHGSGAELESVIDNLLSNAIRHTQADGTITLRWTGDENGMDLAVIDSGCGIAQEYIPRLTERFFRVDRGRDRSEGGVGLGLAIVKHVLERHGATLYIESTPGEGSTFSCHFPADRLVTTEAAPSARNSQTG